MRVEHIPKGLYDALNEATKGQLTDVWLHCRGREWELDLSVVTPEEQMRLCVIGLGSEGSTQFFASTLLDGSAKVLGWNLYLHEKFAEIRGHLNRAHRRLDALEAS